MVSNNSTHAPEACFMRYFFTDKIHLPVVGNSKQQIPADRADRRCPVQHDSRARNLLAAILSFINVHERSGVTLGY